MTILQSTPGISIYGHERGDEVLAAVGAALRSAVRESDFVGRYGGEEFLILYPDTGREAARTAAEAIRHAIATTSVQGVERPITASLGVAVLPEDAVDAATLLRNADRALYAAKTNGRNRVELASAQSPDSRGGGADQVERQVDPLREAQARADPLRGHPRRNA
jgi:GGDEF domain-containing protein